MFWFFVISLHIPNLMWGVGVICYATFNLSILIHFPVPLQAATSDEITQQVFHVVSVFMQVM